MADTTPRKSLKQSAGNENYGRLKDLNDNLDILDSVTMYDENETVTGDWDFQGSLTETPDAITATSEGVAAAVTTVTTEVTTNGDSDEDNVTLANGTAVGQIKKIYCKVVGAVTDALKITPANMVGGTSISLGLNPIGRGVTLVYTASGWVVTGINYTHGNRIVDLDAQFDKTEDTTLENVAGLQIWVTAGKCYKFKANLWLTDGGGAPAVFGKVAIDGTATATSIRYRIDSIDEDGSPDVGANYTALGGTLNMASEVNHYISIEGTIDVNAAGTLNVQFAQVASSVTTVSVLVGSTFEVEEIRE